MKSVAVILMLCLLISSCHKSEEFYENKCCVHSMQISPSNFNHEGVTIFAPQAFTPNEGFSLIGSGFTVKETRIKKNLVVVAKSKEPDFKWTGKVNGDKESAKIFNYEIDLFTHHGEEISVKGKVCQIIPSLNRDDYDDFDPRCKCIFSSNLHPERGMIYDHGGECFD